MALRHIVEMKVLSEFKQRITDEQWAPVSTWRIAGKTEFAL